jgi:hypothetical protein
LPVARPAAAREKKRKGARAAIGATAFALALDAMRGRDDVDEALAAKVAEELHRRFHVPLA